MIDRILCTSPPMSPARNAWQSSQQGCLLLRRLAWVIAAGLCAAVGSVHADDASQDVDFYERKVRPLLARRCYECHSRGSKRPEGGLTLDTRAGVLAGGESGPLINSDQPDESLLLQVIRYDGDLQMPPAGKLSGAERELIVQWVRRGAAMPDDGTALAERPSIDFAAGKQFWAFQPPQRSRAPAGETSDRSAGVIDAFLQAALRQRGLRPSQPADARTLIRRASFDLLGLPPRPEDVEQFVNDTAPDAYQRLIDRLLASPHYGERWGRYWLDLTRYADGNTTSLEVRGRAWLYRDWVVKALNEDMPYDEFVGRQLAADQLPDYQPADLAALGFWGLSPAYFKELKLSPAIIQSIVADEWEERIDALGRTFLGLSLACARCHDHKFDPVSTDDYYALAGVVASTRLIDRFVIPEPQAAAVRQAAEQVQSLSAQVKQLQGAKSATADDKARLAQLQSRIQAIERDTPHYDSAMAHAVDDAALYVLADGPAHTKLEYKPNQALDVPVQIRGNPMKPGRVVPRRFLTVLSSDPPRPFVQGSGRLELAQAIVRDAAPLSARVMVNRVWAHHFGRGLVETVSDFGSQGQRPSHPELLDDLTCRFIEAGWSLKWLHREIMTTAAYRQSSHLDAARFAVDPDNRWLWRMDRRRLDVEAWRDAMLASCGNLDPRIGGAPLILSSADNYRRTLYGKIDRSDPDAMLRLFDFPDPSAHAPRRVPTTTALQQLFVLNGPLMLRQAAALARRLTTEEPADAESIVRRAYRDLLARQPSPQELRLGLDFLAADDRARTPELPVVQQYCQALLGSNEFLFVD
jgi:hypothetical protein